MGLYMEGLIFGIFTVLQTKIRVPFLQSDALIPVSGLRGRFPLNGTDL